MSSGASAAAVNRRVLVARRPVGRPTAEDFALETVALPVLTAGEALIRILWLSIDGFMVGRLRAEENYTSGVAPGDVMQAMAVGEVIASNRSDRRVGDMVVGMMGMQQWFIDRDAVPLSPVDPARGPVQMALGLFGISGWSAYFGLLAVGRPVAGETVVVSAGTGAVGAIVGQIARLHGCRSVAIVGGAEKAALATDVYGYDAAVDRHDPALGARLAAAAPDGIHVYFDNVGGDLYDLVLEQMQPHGRIVVCGRLATAHLVDTALDIGPRDHGRLLVRRLVKTGFLVTDHAPRFAEATAQLMDWHARGQLRLSEDVLHGIENAPAALVRLLTGQNRGKQLVKLADRGDMG